jgi:hypothetical protein
MEKDLVPEILHFRSMQTEITGALSPALGSQKVLC